MELELFLSQELVQLLPDWDELNAQWVSNKIFYSGGPFFARFSAFFRCKKGTLTDFRRKNDENFGFCLFYLGHFSTKERNICLFLFLLSNFLCF